VALAALQGVPDEPLELAVLGIRTLASEYVRVEVWRGGRVVEIWMAVIGGGILITTQSFWQSLG
jgi:hypothetical protein